MLKKDILRTYNLIRGNKLKKILGCWRTPGVQAVVVYRFGRWLLKRNILLRIILEPVHIILYDLIRIIWGIDIPREVDIGEGCYIGHFGGIVIHSSVKIGKNVNISQQTTIGISGQGRKRGCPIIGDNVYIAPGAKIFGKITIGNNVKIGANAVVNKDIPDNAVVALDPGFNIISYNGNQPVD